jgi:hypothetical protein
MVFCWHVFQTKVEYVCLSLMAKIKINNIVTMMEWKDQKCKLMRRRNSARWIPLRIPYDNQIQIKTGGAHRRGEQISGVRSECEDRLSSDPEEGA